MAGWMRIVTDVLVKAFPERLVNIHPSLLPSFRGLDAVGQALKAGVSISGCTVHIVTTELDAGPIIRQESFPVESYHFFTMSMFKLFEAEDILPGFSRSSSERSSSSTGASVMSKSLHAAPSRLEGVNSMWQDLNDYLDLNSDPSLWDLDGGSQKMSDLVIGKKLHAPEQLTMTDTINPYAPLFNSQAHNASLQLNSTIASETSGSSNPRFKTEICRNFKEKGTCLYGELCQFAHGKTELRVSIFTVF